MEKEFRRLAVLEAAKIVVPCADGSEAIVEVEPGRPLPLDGLVIYHRACSQPRSLSEERQDRTHARILQKISASLRGVRAEHFRPF